MIGTKETKGGQSDENSEKLVKLVNVYLFEKLLSSRVYQ